MACRRRCAHLSCSSGGGEEESRDEEDVGVGATVCAVLEEKRLQPRAYLVRKLRHICALQRYWGLLGQRLQEYPASLRDRLRLVWPQIKLAP